MRSRFRPRWGGEALTGGAPEAERERGKGARCGPAGLCACWAGERPAQGERGRGVWLGGFSFYFSFPILFPKSF